MHQLTLEHKLELFRSPRRTRRIEKPTASFVTPTPSYSYEVGTSLALPALALTGWVVACSANFASS